MTAHSTIGAFIKRSCLFAIPALAMPAQALAADLPRRDQPLAPPPHFGVLPTQFSGSYVGGSIGYFALLTENPAVDGFEIGARAGYDEQFGNVVAGVLLNADASFASGSVAGYKMTTPLMLGAYARLGYTVAPKTLAYGLGGVTFLDMKVTTAQANPPNAATGFGLGVGMEHQVADNWTLFGEYRFHRLWTNNDNIINAIEAKFGVNYRFADKQLPLLARY